MKTPPPLNRPSTPPPPPVVAAAKKNDSTRFVVGGILIGAAILLLLLLLLLLALTQIGRRRGTLIGNLAEGSQLEAPSGNHHDGQLALASPSSTLEEAASSEFETQHARDANSTDKVVAADPENNKALLSDAYLQSETLAPKRAFSVRRIDAAVPAASARSSETARARRTLAGVEVKGAIALVCDVSGSMAADFPHLIAELREKFPPDTPLLLVPGCRFNAPNPNARPPQSSLEMKRTLPYVGRDFHDDPHVFWATSTTDAIIFAVRVMERDTVMFNNDLQDGGSISAVKALEELNKSHPFVLSGRSLNRDAPEALKQFMRKSGGDFRVDPIGRTKQPARAWSP